MLGIWKSFDELESSICLDEMWALLAHKRKIENFKRKFDAQLHDKELENGEEEKSEETDIDRIKREVQAELSGMTVEEYTERSAFAEAGIGIEVDDE